MHGTDKPHVPYNDSIRTILTMINLSNESEVDNRDQTISKCCLGSLYQRAIEMVRFKQAKHLVLDVERARDISAQLEEDKIQAAAERLQHKEVISEVGQRPKPTSAKYIPKHTH